MAASAASGSAWASWRTDLRDRGTGAGDPNPTGPRCEDPATDVVARLRGRGRRRRPRAAAPAPCKMRCSLAAVFRGTEPNRRESARFAARRSVRPRPYLSEHMFPELTTRRPNKRSLRELVRGAVGTALEFATLGEATLGPAPARQPAPRPAPSRVRRGRPPPPPPTRTAGDSPVSPPRAGAARSARAHRPAARRSSPGDQAGLTARRRPVWEDGSAGRPGALPGAPDFIASRAAPHRAARVRVGRAALGGPRRRRLVRSTPTQRRPSRPAAAAGRRTGGDLLSQALASQVPSALWGLTALFGMGRGVSPTQ